MASESLVETHVANALQFIALLRRALPLDSCINRYVVEMDLGTAMATAVRTRALASIDAEAQHADTKIMTPIAGDGAAEPDDSEGWRRFRPDVVVREVRERQRRNDRVASWVQLAIARAEETIITTHVENAITFAALLDEFLPLARGVQHYIGAVSLSGGRAQAVYQRTMARLADVHLPPAAAPRA